MGVETYYDEDGKSETVWVKEEPDCYGCNDSGWLSNTRSCPSCNPTRWDSVRQTLRWKVSRLLDLLTGRRRNYTDEAPF